MKRIAAALLIAVFVSAPAHGAKLTITYPVNDSTVSGEEIEITGDGADPDGQLEVKVFTDRWYVQDGTASIDDDGTWSYAPCYLRGKGKWNKHNIRVTVIKNGKRVRSASVRGIVRN